MPDMNKVDQDIMEADLKQLFFIREAALVEMQKRAWKVLEALGYRPYYNHSDNMITLTMKDRGLISIVTITADFQQNHQDEHVQLEMPFKQFEMLLQRDFAK